MQVSLTKVWIVVEGWLGRSAVYTEYRIGDRILPWGTPASIGWVEDKELFKETWKQWFERYDLRI